MVRAKFRPHHRSVLNQMTMTFFDNRTLAPAGGLLPDQPA
jgi:hypothetical protein